MSWSVVTRHSFDFDLVSVRKERLLSLTGVNKIDVYKEVIFRIPHDPDDVCVRGFAENFLPLKLRLNDLKVPFELYEPGNDEYLIGAVLVVKGEHCEILKSQVLS